MPDPTRLLATLRKATQAFRETPGRRGRLVCLENVNEVMVAGDLHGNIENFRSLLIKADLANKPLRHLVLQELIHGPFNYPVGGDKSHQLIDLLAALKCQVPRQVHMLLGNHELSQWTNKLIGKGNVDYNESFREGVRTAYCAQADNVYAAYLEFFATFSLALKTPNRVFISHSLPSARHLATFDPAVLEKDEQQDQDIAYGGTIHSLVWGRDTSAKNVRPFLEKVDADLLITGHIPCDKGFEVPNDRQLILDAMGLPACYCLFPAGRPINIEDLKAGVGML